MAERTPRTDRGGTAFLLAGGQNVWENVWIPVISAISAVAIYETCRFSWRFIVTVPKQSHFAHEREIAELEAKIDRLEAENLSEAAEAENALTVLRYTVKGYTAGENADSKHWRERAERAEAQCVALTRQQEELKKMAGDAYVILEGLRLSVEWELAPSIKSKITEVAPELGKVLAALRVPLSRRHEEEQDDQGSRVARGVDNSAAAGSTAKISDGDR